MPVCIYPHLYLVQSSYLAKKQDTRVCMLLHVCVYIYVYVCLVYV